MDIDTDRRVVSVVEAGRMLGLGRSSAFEAVHRGEIPVIRFNRRLVVPLAALEKLLSSAGQPQDGQSGK